LLNARSWARYDRRSQLPARRTEARVASADGFPGLHFEVTPDMGGGSESKKQQLGKIVLQQRVVSAEELQEQREARETNAGAEASRRAERGPVFEALAAASAQHGLPSVDLSERVIPLSLLKLVPVEMARERLVMPFSLDGDRLLVALTKPSDGDLLEELAFVAGKNIEPHISLEPMVRNVIEHAYGLLARGEDSMYVGSCVSASQLAALGLPNLPRAPDPMKVHGAPGASPEPPAGAAARESAPEPEADPEISLRPQPIPSEPPELDTAFGQRTRPSEMPPMLTPETDVQVLLACSSGPLREPLRAALTELGLKVLEADSGVTALELAREQDPRVLVLDADLDLMHGFEVWRRLRSTTRFAQTPVIFITGGPRQWRLREDLREQLGVSHCHARPVEPKKLARTVRLLLDDPQAPPELLPLSPESEALWNAAMQAFQGGDIDRAIAMLETGLAADSEAFELRYHLGLLYGRRDNAFAAIRALESAVVLQPQHFSALKNLAVVYQRAGFRNASVDVWQQAMAAAPDEETRATIRTHMLSLL
jgi:DNA-binding response OmpR family regulator